MPSVRALVPMAVLLVPLSAALAQPVRVIVRDGDAVGPPGQTVTSITAVTANGVGGFGVAINGTDVITTLSQILATTTAGLATPALPTAVRTEGTVGPYVQTSFEGEFGLSDAGEIAYGTTGTEGGFTGLDTAFLDSIKLASERDSADPPFPGMFWVFNSRIKMTHSGIPYWRAGITATVGGATTNRALVKGTAGTGTPIVKILAGGDLLTNLPAPISMTTASFTYALSANGTNAISDDSVGPPTTSDSVIVVNNAGLILDGVLVREANTVPASVGGRNAENWANFDKLGIAESGRYMIVGDTSDATTLDDFVLVDGVFRIRDGDTVDGTVVVGDIEDAYLTEDGDTAVLWDSVNNTIETLLLNSRIIMREGDPVDLDRDGTPDPNSRIVNMGASAFGIAVTPRIGGLVRVYVAADVDINNTTTTTDDIETVLEIPVCLPDINRVGGVTVQDIFDFLSLYFANDPAADYNNSFSVTVQDIFDFLGGYFAGCV